MSGDSAPIKVDETTWRRLNSLKTPGDTFNDVVERLLDESEEHEDEIEA